MLSKKECIKGMQDYTKLIDQYDLNELLMDGDWIQDTYRFCKLSEKDKHKHSMLLISSIHQCNHNKILYFKVAAITMVEGYIPKEFMLWSILLDKCDIRINVIKEILKEYSC